jgi:hypothetical protein
MQFVQQEQEISQSASMRVAIVHSVAETLPMNELFCNNIVGETTAAPAPNRLGIVPVKPFPDTSKTSR